MYQIGHSYRQYIFEKVFIYTSCFSAITSSFIVLTCLLFPKYGNKYFVRLVYWMAFCDLCASSIASFGFPNNNNLKCSFQSFWIWFFFRSYWIWTVMLSYQLYRLITHQKLINIKYLHIISWSLSLFGTLLPLTSGANYGMIDSLRGHAWCFLDNCTRSELRFWVYMTIQTYVWTSVFIMILLFFLAYRYYHYESGLNNEIYDIKKSEYHHVLQQAIYQISLYPLCMLISWGPNMIIFPLFEAGIVPILYFDISLVMGTLNGVLSGFIFFLRSKEAQLLWYNLIKYRRFSIDQQDQRLIFSSNRENGNFSSNGKDDHESHISGFAHHSEKDINRVLSVDPSRDTSTSDIEFVIRPRSSIFDYEPSSPH